MCRSKNHFVNYGYNNFHDLGSFALQTEGYVSKQCLIYPNVFQ